MRRRCVWVMTLPPWCRQTEAVNKLLPNLLVATYGLVDTRTRGRVGVETSSTTCRTAEEESAGIFATVALVLTTGPALFFVGVASPIVLSLSGRVFCLLPHFCFLVVKSLGNLKCTATGKCPARLFYFGRVYKYV